MILMVPLMIETFARKLEEVRAAGLPAEPVRKKMFGERLHTICSGGAYLILIMLIYLQSLVSPYCRAMA